MPHTLAAIATLALLVVPLAARAEEQPGEEPQSAAPQELGFLVAGKDYVIRFPESHNIFKTSRSEVTQATIRSEAQTVPAPGDETSDKGEQRTETRPATWTINYSIQVFHVVRFGGGSWVLLRHPAKIEDSFKWFGHRRALAILESGRVEKIKEEPEGEEKVARLREAAEREIETDETWVNLAHAVAIADVPTEDVELQLSINSKVDSR